MAATTMATQIPRFFCPISTRDSLILKNVLHVRHGTTPSRRISPLRSSSDPQRQDADIAKDKALFLSQDDFKYLANLGVGSVLGAAAIKYGSIIFPEMTRPSLALALFMISAPVVVAVLLLINQSRVG